MTQSQLVCFVVVSGLWAGCGSNEPTPSEACEQLAENVCERLYACFTEEELAASGLPATEMECIAAQLQQNACTQQTTSNTCDTGETYHADRAADCVDQVGDLTCDEIRNPELIEAAAPACSRVCEAD